MDQTHPKPSLRTRIEKAESRSSYSVDRSVLARPRQPSFVEQYRGTEYETPTKVMVVREPLMTRGRAFVLVLGTAVVGVGAMLLETVPAWGI